MLHLMCINIHCRKVYYAFGIPVHDYCVNILPTHEVMYVSKCIIVFSSQTHLKMTRKDCWNKQHTTTNTSDYITQCWCETPKYKIYTTYTTRFVTNTSATVNICYLEPAFCYLVFRWANILHTWTNNLIHKHKLYYSTLLAIQAICSLTSIIQICMLSSSECN